MSNFNTMMQQAQKMQKKMAKMQEKLENIEIEGTAGGGMVKIVVTGGMVFKSVKIDGQAVDPDDVEMLEDLILAALSDASKRVENLRNKEMSKITGGMNIPGLL